jgi:hypothetical protein
MLFPLNVTPTSVFSEPSSVKPWGHDRTKARFRMEGSVCKLAYESQELRVIEAFTNMNLLE